MLNATPTLTLILILIHTLPWTKNKIITLTVTLCCRRYNRRSNYWITSFSFKPACLFYFVQKPLLIESQQCVSLKFLQGQMAPPKPKPKPVYTYGDDEEEEEEKEEGKETPPPTPPQG